MLIIPPLLQHLINMLPPEARSQFQTSGSGSSPFVKPAARLAVGVVDSVIAGQYMVIVGNASGNPVPIKCTLAAELGLPFYGANNSFLPLEWSRVLVLIPYDTDPIGYIIGVLPGAGSNPLLNDNDEPILIKRNCIDMEPAVSCYTEKIYRTMSEENNSLKGDANYGRAIDLLPGNWMTMNELGVSVGVLNLLAFIKGSENAQIVCSPIDDTVKLISGFYQHFSALGGHSIYNDGALLTDESEICIHQAERAGQSGFKAVTKDGDNQVTIDQNMEAGIVPVDEDVVSRPRALMFKGYLGDIINLFILNPDPNFVPLKASDKAKHQGLAQYHIDTSGRTSIRTTSGFTVQGSKPIPVPKRLKEAWDPEGDKVEEALPTNAKEPFTIPGEHASSEARALYLRDMLAWRNMQSVQRLTEQSKDIYIPEESEVNELAETHDPIGKAKRPGTTSSGAVFSVEDDGSIILRSAGGAEFILTADGQILFNAPNGIHQFSGRDVVTLGNNVVIKGKSNVDVYATDGSIGIKGGKNVEVLAATGGVMVESSASADIVSGGPGVQAEDTVLSGIMIKSNTRVMVASDQVQLNASGTLKLSGFNIEGKPTGSLWVSMMGTYIINKELSWIATGEGAGLVLTPGMSALYGNSTLVIGDSLAAVISDSKLQVPMQQVDIGSNPATLFKSTAKTFAAVVFDENWLTPFLPSVIKNINFKYRANYKVSKLYQPFWSYLVSIGAIEGETSVWTEQPIDDNYAWPGKSHYEESQYFKLAEEVNIDTDTGIPVKRAELKGEPGTFESDTFGSYEVLI